MAWLNIRERPTPSTATACGPVMRCQHTPDDVLVELHPKSIRQLLGDSRATKTWVALFEFDRADQFR